MLGQVKLRVDGLWSERLAQSREHAQDLEAEFREADGL